MSNIVTESGLPNKVIVTTTRAPGIQQFLWMVQVFTVPGTISTGVGRARFYCPGAATLSHVRASVGGAPTGSDIIVDVNKNGTTVFTNQTSRPKIFAGQTTAVGTPAVTTIAQGDYITVDIDAVGSLFAGSDLTVQVELTP